jgi:hypothetical protein
MARVKVGEKYGNTKKKEQKEKVDVSKLDPSFLDRIANFDKARAEAKQDPKEDPKQVESEQIAAMPDEEKQGLREKLVAKKSGANAAPVEDRQEQDPANREEKPQEKPPGDDPGEEQDKPSMFGMDNFKSAFSYFGPRLASMLIGGSVAMETTDTALDELYDRETAERKELREAEEAKAKAERDQELTPYQKLRLEQAERRLVMGEGQEEGKQARFERSMGYKERMAERPGPKVMLEQAAQKTLLNHLDALEGLASSVEQSYRGPISGIAKDIAVKYGVDNDAKWAQFSARSNMVLNSYIKSITGAQSGAEEQKRLGKDVPGPKDTPTVFAAKTQMMRDAAQGRLTAVNDALENYGFKGANLTKEQRQANANIAANVLADKLAELSAQNKESKPDSGLSAEEQAELEQLRKEAAEGKF